MNKCLFTPDGGTNNRPKQEYQQCLTCDPIGFTKVTYGNTVEGLLRGEKMTQRQLHHQKFSPMWVAAYESWNTPQLAISSKVWRVSLTGRHMGCLPSSLLISASFSWSWWFSHLPKDSGGQDSFKQLCFSKNILPSFLSEFICLEKGNLFSFREFLEPLRYLAPE